MVTLLLQELLGSIGSVDFSSGKAHITEVTKCTGDVSVSTMLFSFTLNHICNCVDFGNFSLMFAMPYLFI